MKNLENLLNYQFKNSALLEEALRHRSAGKPHNERLEFLGDAVLGFIISTALYQQHPAAKEGELSRLRAALVNRDVLAEFATTLNLGDVIELGPGEIKTGGATRPSLLADAVEALIGAIYLDGGMAAASACVQNYLGPRMTQLTTLVKTQNIQNIKDAKSVLQEYVQSKKLPLPEYRCESQGLAHQPVFYVRCHVVGLPYITEGVSDSRRKAEQIAAQHFLDKLNER